MRYNPNRQRTRNTSDKGLRKDGMPNDAYLLKAFESTLRAVEKNPGLLRLSSFSELPLLANSSLLSLDPNNLRTRLQTALEGETQ